MTNTIQDLLPPNVLDQLQSSFASGSSAVTTQTAGLVSNPARMKELTAGVAASNEQLNELITEATRTPRLRKRFIPDRPDAGAGE